MMTIAPALRKMMAARRVQSGVRQSTPPDKSRQRILRCDGVRALVYFLESFATLFVISELKGDP
ncbi:MAG TPA: hypothetical protein VNH19_14640 [Candidatus Limnocylindrales bacterium]|nr:hypothetical protein [Candidatus Limnocylindrales bacterium]